jgi:hypothetical protein
MPICIYCDNPDRDSESHIFPEGLGIGPTLEPGVCANCNHRINREVEEPIIKGLAPIRHFLQLLGKRGEPAPLEVEVSYGDKTRQAPAKTPVQLTSKIFVFEEVTDSTGKKREIAVIASDETKVAGVKEKYEAKHPGATLTPIPPEQIEEELRYKTYFDFAVFADPRCLRMVAKIALEWWCRNRSPEVIKSPDYSDIVRYIIEGSTPEYPIVSILNNKQVLDQFWPITFGPHVLFISTNADSHNLVVLVGLFGLVYYKVIVTRGYPRLHTYQQLNLIHPQKGDVAEFDNRIKSPNPSKLLVNEVVAEDYFEPLKVIEAMQPALLDRLNQGMDRIWSGSKKEKDENS